MSYRQFVDATGPFVISLIRVDLARGDLELRVLRAHDQLRAREKTTEIVGRAQASGDFEVVAAVNGDFFNVQNGENENNQVIAGEWWKGLKVTDSPYDTYDNIHVQFALDATGRRPAIDRFILDATAWAGNTAILIVNVNLNPVGQLEGTALYTARIGRDGSARYSTGHRGSCVTGCRTPRRHTAVRASGPGNSKIGIRNPAQWCGARCLPDWAAHQRSPGAGRRRYREGVAHELPRLPDQRAPSLLIGGWPRIVRDGDIVAQDARIVEGTISRNAEMRHPRTAIGFSRDSATLFLLAVDGRSERSVGMTLVKLAALMRRLGAWQAMNFDGGGSTTMVIAGQIVNRPADASGERTVGNVLAVVRRKR